MILPFSIFLLSFALILWSGGLLPRALVGIARILRFSQFITAFLLVSFATSIPELFIGIVATFQGVSNISLGNVLGANLVNMTLVIGVSTLIAGKISGNGKISSENFWIIFLLAIFPIFLAIDGVISRVDGLILLVAFALYITKIFRDKEYFHKHLHSEKHNAFATLEHVIKYFGIFIGGMVLLLTGSFLLIWSAKEIVITYFDARFVFFGMLFLALGTALPELVFGIRISKAGHGTAMLGNALGTIAFNSAGIIGLIALLRPIEVSSFDDLRMVGILLFIAFVLFHFFVYTKHGINRKEAVALLLVYGAFLFFAILDCVLCLVN